MITAGKTKHNFDRVIIVDPHPIVTDGLKNHLEATGEFEVVATVKDSNVAFLQVLEDQPDLVIMELELPGRGATGLAEHLRYRLPATKILFFTSYLTDVFLDLALQIGVDGYMLKSDDVPQILAGIREIMQGETYFSGPVMDRLEYDVENSQYQVKTQSFLASLTLRQLQVLRHLVRGESVKEVAKVMTLSERAIESHKYRIMQKLGIHDRVELARFAIREGLMPA